jgi:CheY-like chemotaxis protein
MTGGESAPAGRTVLYIEDNAGNVQLMRRVLGRRPDAELLVAGTARDGVDAAVRQRPALILLDNRLPDASGRDVLRELAASEATAAIPVIVISGDSGGQATDELLELGAAGFLPKPFDIHQLLSTIDQYL